MYLQLYQIKKQLNLDSSFHDDDEYLMDLAKVAENAIQKHIDTPLSEFAATTEVPLAYDYLLSLYKNYNGPHEWTPNI